MGNEKTPYKQFGLELKRLRSKAAKTPAEVSGAIEIDEIRLAKFENGELRVYFLSITFSLKCALP